MPFTEPLTLTISVTQTDIDNATTGESTNSVCQALIRLNNAQLLPGDAGDPAPQTGCGWIATISPVLISSGVYLAQVLVCSYQYGADPTSSLIIAAENLGLKPSGPYTVNLTKVI